MTHHHEHRDSRDLWIQTGRKQHKLEKHHTCKHLLIYKVVMQKKCNLEKHYKRHNCRWFNVVDKRQLDVFVITLIETRQSKT